MQKRNWLFIVFLFGALLTASACSDDGSDNNAQSPSVDTDNAPGPNGYDTVNPPGPNGNGTDTDNPPGPNGSDTGIPPGPIDTGSDGPVDETDPDAPCEDILPPAGAMPCDDIAPDSTYTCEEQASWGKCDEPWMMGLCNKSCGRCDAQSGSCAALAEAGHCTQPWMQGYCQRTCERCPGDVSRDCPAPVMPGASQATKDVLCYLYDIYGTKVLSGQQDCHWSQSPGDIGHIHNVTGKYPAIVGGDMLYDNVVTQAVAQWNAGGLSMIRYHMGLPDEADSYESSLKTTDLADTLTPGTARYNGLMQKFDHAAARLQTLKDAGVVVLWAPFHEVQPEGWFWWPKGTPEQLRALWHLMFDNFSARGLDNIIWLFAYSHNPHEDWLPDEGTFDLAGPDTYADNPPFVSMFGKTRWIVGPSRPIPLHETGLIVDPAEMFDGNQAPWVLFSVWCAEWLLDNTDASLQRAYAHPSTINRDGVPAFGR